MFLGGGTYLGGPDTSSGFASLGTIRDTIRQRADMVNTQFVTDAELNGYINTSYQELYGILIQHFGDDYAVADPVTVTTDGLNDHFALPSDFFKLLGVDVKVDGTRWVNVPRFNFGERNKYTVSGAPIVFDRSLLRYRVSGSSLWLSPFPTSGQVLRLFYIPRLDPLVADADTLDGVNGWEEYIVADCCIKLLQKEESDPSVFMSQKQALLARIESEAANRDAGSPSTVVDVYANGSGYGPGRGGWGGSGWGPW